MRRSACWLGWRSFMHGAEGEQEEAILVDSQEADDNVPRGRAAKSVHVAQLY